MLCCVPCFAPSIERQTFKLNLLPEVEPIFTLPQGVVRGMWIHLMPKVRFASWLPHSPTAHHALGPPVLRGAPRAPTCRPSHAHAPLARQRAARPTGACWAIATRPNSVYSIVIGETSMGTQAAPPVRATFYDLALGWAARYSSRSCVTSTCVYICVVEISACPRISCKTRRSAPPASTWVANE